MPTLSAVTLLLALIQGSRDKIVDKLSGRTPAIPRGNAVNLRCGIFISDPAAASLVDDLSNIASVTMQVRNTNALGTAIFDKTVAIADFEDTGLTWSDWDAKTSWHFSVLLTAEETGQAVGSTGELPIYIAFEAQPVSGDPIFLGSITTVIFEDGIGSSGSPVVGDPTYLTAAQARAEFSARGVTGPDYRSDITGLTGGTSTDLDSIATEDLDAGYLIAVIISGALRYYLLEAGTAAESSPETIRPDDYASSTNEKIWTQVL